MFWQIVWFLRIKGGVTVSQLLCGKISSFYLCRIKISPVKITLWTVWGLTFWYRWGCRYQISTIVTEQQTSLVWDSSPPVACVTLRTGISCSSKTTLERSHLKQDLVSFSNPFVQISCLTRVAPSAVIWVHPGNNLLFHLEKWMIQKVLDLTCFA